MNASRGDHRRSLAYACLIGIGVMAGVGTPPNCLRWSPASSFLHPAAPG